MFMRIDLQEFVLCMVFFFFTLLCKLFGALLLLFFKLQGGLRV